MKFSIKQFLQGSIDNGHAKTAEEAYIALSNDVVGSFSMKLVEQKVPDLEAGERVAILVSGRLDSAVVLFRGKYFLVSSNPELLDNGLDHWVFSIIDDPVQIKIVEEDTRKAAEGAKNGPLRQVSSRPKTKDYLN